MCVFIDIPFISWCLWKRVIQFRDSWFVKSWRSPPPGVTFNPPGTTIFSLYDAWLHDPFQRVTQKLKQASWPIYRWWRTRGWVPPIVRYHTQRPGPCWTEKDVSSNMSQTHTEHSEPSSGREQSTSSNMDSFSEIPIQYRGTLNWNSEWILIKKNL